jgi:hypothetical protein
MDGRAFGVSLSLMKKVSLILILFGGGLVAFGVTGFSGEFSPNTRPAAYDQPYEYSGSFGWSMNERMEITFGLISLVSGIILRKNSN